MNFKKATSILTVTMGLIISTTSYAMTNPFWSKICTGEKVFTLDGDAATVVGLFLDQRRVQVQFNQVNGTDTVNLESLALTNICLERGAVCTGDSFYTEDGDHGTIVAISPIQYKAVVIFDNSRWYDVVPIYALALSNACEDIGSCHKYRQKRIWRQ